MDVIATNRGIAADVSRGFLGTNKNRKKPYKLHKGIKKLPPSGKLQGKSPIHVGPNSSAQFPKGGGAQLGMN